MIGVEEKESLEIIDTILNHIEELFLLVVVGEVKSGKSSFINALFGEKICKEGVTPVTDKINIIKFGEEINVVPDIFVRRVKNVRTVLMNIDARCRIVIGITVAADMIAFFNDQNFFAGFFDLMGEDGPEKTLAPHNKIQHLDLHFLSYSENSTAVEESI